jgi:hypothetical protein
VHENLKALQVMPKLKAGVMEELNRIFPEGAF